ncbi:MAG: hypothetical protein M3N37_01905 [Actinomycetota bacterium]|nr:hypothetical protein [Actinomycetota bacterium]
MSRRGELRRSEDEPPSLQVVLSGGVGVLAVVVFVTALAFGTEVGDPPSGARLGVVAAAGPAGAAIAVPRCRAERVVRVEVRQVDGPTLWRVVSPKGSIDERYVVGSGDPPFGFVVDVPAPVPLPPGPLTAVVALAGEPFDDVDEVTFDPAEVPASGVRYRGRDVDMATFDAHAAAAADCQEPGRDLGLVTWAFVAAALGVVVSYAMMVRRYLRGRARTR